MSVTLTDEQFAAMLAALGNKAPATAPVDPTGLGEAVTRYLKTCAGLKPSSVRSYRYLLRNWATALGWTKPLATVTRADLAKYLEGLPPGHANNAATRLRTFYKWAADAGLVPAPLLPRVAYKAKGHAPWSDADLEAYRACWPAGSRQRLVFEAALATGLRRSDLAAALWQPAASLNTQKTGAVVWLGALEAVRAAYKAPLGARLCGHSLGLKFTAWSHAAGLKRRTIHGLRKTFLTRAAEAGCTAHEIMTLAGHSTLAMAGLYTRTADRAKLAKSAAAKLAGAA